MEVETAEVEAGTLDALDGRAGKRSAGIGIDQNFASADPVPDGKDAEGDRPIARILPDRGIAVVHQLIAVILELLSKVVEHRPRLMASRAAQAVLPGECGDGFGRRRTRQNYEPEKENQRK